jgi:hypothetical protein
VSPPFCILAAGRGSRLDPVTRGFHKALLPVQNRAVISHVIDLAPEGSQIVIALGYDADKVKDYCLVAHPERDFTFVEVENWDDSHGGPGASLYACREHLSGPFFVACCDGIFPDCAPLHHGYDWISVHYGLGREERKSYATAEVRLSGMVQRLDDKSAEPNLFTFTGLAFVESYEIFWLQLQLNRDLDREWSLVCAWKDPEAYPLLWSCTLPWSDTGNPSSYQGTLEKYSSRPLGMEKNTGERTYRVGDRLIKLCEDPEKQRKRVERWCLFSTHAPKLLDYRRHALAFEWIEGRTLYDLDYGPAVVNLLHWLHRAIWRSKTEEIPNFEMHCWGFYHGKTWDRVTTFLRENVDLEHGTINRWGLPSIYSLLDEVPWEEVCQGIPVAFHGDLQYDNVLYDQDGYFRIIDWREEFGDLVELGDAYWDLGKLLMGLQTPLHEIKRGNFSFVEEGDGVCYSFSVSPTLKQAENLFRHEVEQMGYDLKRVDLLAALALLNMAPHHPGKVGRLFYTCGKLRLHDALLRFRKIEASS